MTDEATPIAQLYAAALAEIERLRSMTCKCVENNARAEAAEKDAARYRWLLANRVTENDEGEKCIYFWCGFEHYDDVDAAIDAAIAAT